jgi:hypothetical protein
MMGISIMTSIALVVVTLGWPADPGEMPSPTWLVGMIVEVHSYHGLLGLLLAQIQCRGCSETSDGCNIEIQGSHVMARSCTVTQCLVRQQSHGSVYVDALNHRI